MTREDRCDMSVQEAICVHLEAPSPSWSRSLLDETSSICLTSSSGWTPPAPHGFWTCTCQELCAIVIKNTEFVRICNTQGVIVLKQTLIWSPEVESKKEQILLFCTSVVDFSGICTMSSIQKQSAKHSHVLHSSPLITGCFPCATICWELDVLVEKHTLHFCYFLNMYSPGVCRSSVDDDL